ncbi:hypothetical protein GQX74_011984 [Glossina fuscipes]|nr:hypothetical protein GQX74_011984 [Glossina fuscipes]
MAPKQPAEPPATKCADYKINLNHSTYYTLHQNQYLFIVCEIEISVAKHQVVAYTQKSQIKHENRHIQLVREYGFHPRTKATVEDGDVLPKKFEPFPENMYGKPLEEIDTFIYEEMLTKCKGSVQVGKSIFV